MREFDNHYKHLRPVQKLRLEQFLRVRLLADDVADRIRRKEPTQYNFLDAQGEVTDQLFFVANRRSRRILQGIATTIYKHELAPDPHAKACADLLWQQVLQERRKASGKKNSE